MFEKRIIIADKNTERLFTRLVKYLNRNNSDIIDLVDADTTPSVKDGDKFRTNNTGATTITQLDDWEPDTVKTIIAGDGNTTIIAGGNFKLSANWTPAQYDSITLLSDGTYGIELSRSMLDDYEEGTWTPVLTDLTNNATMNIQVGRYTKIGRMIFLTVTLSTTNLGSVSGDLYIRGLPFTSANVGSLEWTMAAGRGALLNIPAGESIVGRIQANVDYFILEKWDATAGTTTLQGTDWSPDGYAVFSGHYMVQ